MAIDTKGKAFEYATALAFYNLIFEQGGLVSIREDSSFQNARKAFSLLDNIEKNKLHYAAISASQVVINLEPSLRNMTSELTISIAPDYFGQDGDVRDVILSKEDWEIGISCKHNHNALKHQRLSDRIDFGVEWVGHPVSENYWNSIAPIFQMLQQFRESGVNWRDLSEYGISKENDIYRPLLTSFLEEFDNLDNSYPDLAPRFMEYLAGRRDFYKFVMNEIHQEVHIYSYNLHGDLGLTGDLPIIQLPTRFLRKDWKINRDGTTSSNTLIIEMDNDWIIGLRIHSAASRVETSLKFDTQPIRLPVELVPIVVQY
nr:HaeIII family restriction endonuclease [uncultured Granulicatella sp.]